MKFISLLFSLVLAAITTSKYASMSSNEPSFRAEALGPLNRISDWNSFKRDLLKIKAAGVEALATDVWWGQVETSDQVFDWSYYDQLSSVVIQSGLLWIPILSTHACGGYGQACNIPVPAWAGLSSQESYQNIDIFGNVGREAFSPFAGEYMYTQYRDLFTAFAAHFASKAAYIPRLDLSGGPSGELRYPSYTLNWNYPQRGQLQAYSNAAVASFRNYTLTKYGGSLASVSKAWSTNINKISDIRPPCTTTTSPTTFGVCVGMTTSDDFFSQGYKSAYGRDFLTWYQTSLITHSSRLASIAHTAFDPVFTSASSIAIKVAGVHWQYYSPSEPHSGEYTSGYVDYRSLLSALGQQGLGVTFTAIEMDDNNNAPYYSGAHTLTMQVFGICRDLGISCGAENALDITGSGGDMYSNVRSVLTTFYPTVKSLTFLRYNDLASSLDNIQAYATYIAAIPQPSNTLFFKVTGIALTRPGQVISVVGNRPELGNNSLPASFQLIPFDCNGNLCTWIGTARCTPTTIGTSPAVSFSVTILDPQSSLVQCGSPYTFTPDTKATYIVVNQGTGNYVADGIRILQVGNPTVSCPPSNPNPNPGPSPSPSSTSSEPSPTPSSQLVVKVTHDTGLGDSLYITGTFQSWSTCSSIACIYSSGVWVCPLNGLVQGQRYEWKAFQYGSKTGTKCGSPVWMSGPNQVFTYNGGQGEIVYSY